MRKSCVTFTRSCLTCQLEQLHQTNWWAGVMRPLPEGPRVVWVIDMIVITIGGMIRYIIVAVCCFTKYIFTRVLLSKAAAITAKILAELIGCFGVMHVVHVDSGSEFGGDFASFCEA